LLSQNPEYVRPTRWQKEEGSQKKEKKRGLGLLGAPPELRPNKARNAPVEKRQGLAKVAEHKQQGKGKGRKGKKRR